ncbi:MAG TPA: type II toxin-antitoxin system HipA family toxin [Methylibium sp.]|uniref:type II toxin-antitoxin system HipA family toxin n=1 Tax=Methylibium sp. TaxID=2067992 RepID=UPI002DBC6240|nr:type II toxin-antitoxin system HipA family toxin [Methylibium sp.]HEU4457864.1 type II toxin-antitoxin system HipA family toxin [Methylibium sp.]
MNGERVGRWSATPAGDELTYDAAWLASSQSRPLSLSLPMRAGNLPIRGPAVRAWFDNLLPDSQPILDRMARRFGAASTDAFDLLAQIGRDCVGAVQLLPEDEAPGTIETIQARPLDEAAVARRLRNATFASPLRDDADDLRISIAGAQEKTALLWHRGAWWRPLGATPTTHILKLPMGLVGNARLDLRHSIENEWLCAQILAAYRLDVARCHPLLFEDQRVLAVERFDRRWAGNGRWLLRLPQEDMCQATGTPAFAKYEADGGPGIDRILGLLDGSIRREQDREAFFRAQLLFWMLRAPDGHAKNFSIALHAGGRYALTPLYDVLSFFPMLGAGPNQVSEHKIRLAMAVRSKNPHWRMKDIVRRHWIEVGRRHGILGAQGLGPEAVVQDVVERTPGVVDAVANALPKGFPAVVADRILGGLKRVAAEL